jgi:hypothetical protein
MSCCPQPKKKCAPKEPMCKVVRICREPSKVKVMEVSCPKKDKIVCTKVKG